MTSVLDPRRRPRPVETVAIRSASEDDSEAIARLVTALGYPTSTSQMRRRLDRIFENRDYQTLVAVAHGHVVGVVGTRTGLLYEDDSAYGQIMALAVAPSRQRRGVGRMLMQAAEAALVERGVRVLVVTSGNHRSDAHACYERCGYGFTGRRYRKSIANP